MNKYYVKTPIGLLPNDWHVEQLDSVANVIMGQSPKSESYNENNEGLPLVQGNADCVNRRTIPRVYTSQITKVCEIEDVIMTVRAPVGAISRSQHNACIGRGVCALRSNDSFDGDFLYQYMISFEDKWASLSQGSTFTAVNSKDVKSINIPVPPLLEQNKIAKILSTVDEHIDEVDGMIDDLKELKNGLMQKLLTEGIGHTEFMDSDVGKIPVEWEVKKLSDVTEIVNGGTPSTKKPEYWVREIYWATPTDITSNGKYINMTEKMISKIGLENCSAAILPVNAILMTSRATIGECCMNTRCMATNQGFKSFVCSQNIYHEYLYYKFILMKDDLIRLSSGSTFLEISKKAVADIKISIPPIKEQIEISNVLSGIDERIDLYYENKKSLEGLKEDLCNNF